MNRLQPVLLILIAVATAGCAAEPAPQGRLVLQNGRWVRQAKPAKGTAAGELALIHLYVNRKDDSAVIDTAEEFLEKYPDDGRCEEVLMLAGAAWMNRGRYYLAYEDFYKKQLDEFPAGKYFERTLQKVFQIADAFLKGRKQVIWGFLYLPAEDEGLEILMQIAQYAPGSVLAEDALLRIADQHLGKKRYAEAVEAYDNYLELFGKSSRAPLAMLRSAQAVYLTFRSVEYNTAALTEAKLRFETFEKCYRSAAAEVGAKETIDEINVLLAHKDYHTAAFYERTDRAEAAIFYYRQVVKRYGQTKWTPKALASLKRLGSNQ